MFSRFMWALGCTAVVLAGLVLQPAAPAHASGTFFMVGQYEMHNGFATRRRIHGFQSPVVTTDPSGMGGVTILPSVFSLTGNPTKGADRAKRSCDPNDPAALICMLNFGSEGFAAFPGFPVFAQNASTFTEKNVTTAMLGPGAGPGSFNFCPLVGNAANGPGTPACPGLGFGSPTGVQGIVQYSGGNGFGGTMAILRNVSVVVAQRRNVGPSRYQYDLETRMANWMIGVPMSSTFTNQVTPPGPITQSPVFGPFTSIQTVGPIVQPVGAAVLPSTSTGFPWTTGMIRAAEDSCVQAGTCPSPFNPNPFVQFTLTGSDARGPDGQGQLSLVAGGIFQNRDGLTTGNHGSLDLTFTLPEPATALGLASGILLMLGLARRRS